MTSMSDNSTTQTVLLVDDHNEIRALFARFIAPLGINVIETENGREALAILKKQSIDVVVSDLIMPHMSGLMLLHSMLENGHLMPFILVTGFSDKDSAIQALRLGAFDYLEKPVDEGDLRSVVEEALKVSREQHQLITKIHTPHATAPIDPNAEMLIMKMRAFRHRDEAHDFPVSNGLTSNWHDLKELFIREAQPQLVFAESTLKALLTSDNLARELAFSLRVVQTIRMASEAIRLTDIAAFARSLESALASFKVAPQQLNSDHVDLLVSGTTILREKVAAIDRESVRATQKRLDDLSENQSQVAETKKAG